MPRRMATDVEAKALKVETFKQCLMECQLEEKDANNYAIALVDDGYDRPDDVADLEEDDFPETIKKGHRRKIMKRLKPATKVAAKDADTELKDYKMT